MTTLNTHSQSEPDISISVNQAFGLNTDLHIEYQKDKYYRYIFNFEPHI